MNMDNHQKLADKLGLPVEVVRRAYYQIDYKLSIKRRPNGRFLLRAEARLVRNLKIKLNKQKNYIIEAMADLTAFKQKGVRFVDKKTLDDELNEMLGEMPEKESIANDMAKIGGIVMLKAGLTTIRKYNLAEFGVSFDLQNPAAIKWLEGLTTLHLSDRNGSITRTTKRDIIKIITQGAKEGLSYTEMAKKIEGLGAAGTFSRARAELISTRTLAEAYEVGNRQPIEDAILATGGQWEKSWITVGDNNVTDECQHNELEGWIPFNQAHASGDQNPPRLGNPRCRCSEAYRARD